MSQIKLYIIPDKDECGSWGYSASNNPKRGQIFVYIYIVIFSFTLRHGMSCA